MLDRAGHAIFRHPPQLGRRDLSCYQRIFRKILEIAPVQRIAVYIHARAEQGIYPVFPELCARHLIELLQQFFVE